MNETIKQYFYDVETGYSSPYRLYKKLIEDGYKDIRLDDVKQFYDNQEVNQQTMRKPKRLDIIYNSVIASEYGANYQIDIIVYDRFEYHKYKYILCVIDIYSRYACCRAMTTRSNEAILENIKSCFEIMGIPKLINADNKFNTHYLNRHYDENDITTNFSQADEINKQAIVERFNRTLCGLIHKWRLATGRYDWYKILDDIVENYNMTYHRTIKTTPYKVFLGLDDNHQMINVVEHDFKIGDKVRSSIHKNVFSKGDEILWREIIYTVTEINKNKIYITNNGHQLKKYFKPYELMIINNDVGKFEKPETEHKVIHDTLKKEKKISKEIKKEGLDRADILDDSVKRNRKPVQRFTM